MAIFLLILQIVSAIPSIISTIKAIMDIIHGLRGEAKKEATAQLKVILKRHTAKNKPVAAGAAKADLEQFLSDLKDKHGIV